MNIDMIKIFHTLIIFFLDSLEHRHDDSDFKFLLVDNFRQSIHDIG